ncbi:NmrA/HSCARG family protein [Prochlorococcus sp. MIT 1223]|uniref:NmrA/HSCARG family protein n=1 Tax=Prochlorococcus sp. MIT 1223 TaxID=3096217 RepID=UPI002A75D604|nr:NmrA/HSCARG family protein [Prochlorococcus sp. MIT 1223]
MKDFNATNKKPIIAVTMATGRQGMGVVKELSLRNEFQVRAITRDASSKRAIALSKLANVEIVEGDLLDSASLYKCFDKVYGIFGNTTPTKGLKPLVREYEIEQGKVLIDVVTDLKKKNNLKHFVFSSICKAKDPLNNEPAPGHFTSKWDIEEYLSQNKLNEITTIVRPASYFENFDGDLPGLKITDTNFPGVVRPDKVWQTIAVNDVGIWSGAIFANPKRFIGKSFNLAGEELTGRQMAELVQKVRGKGSKKVRYLMAPRILLKLFVNDIGVMADWIERAGYGADISNLKRIANEEGIEMTSLASWLKDK